jgi:hypothetical protein
VTDEEAEFLYPIFAQRAKQTPERSRALPQYAYRNPELNASFKKRDKGKAMDRISDREIADSLLIEWYRWAKSWRPALGAPRISPTFQEHKQKHEDEKHKGWEISDETYEDDAYERLHKIEMEAIEYCVDALPVPLQQAIGTEMRNREVKAKVWRSPSNRTYTEALDAILPVMRKRGLFD